MLIFKLLPSKQNQLQHDQINKKSNQQTIRSHVSNGQRETSCRVVL